MTIAFSLNHTASSAQGHSLGETLLFQFVPGILITGRFVLLAYVTAPLGWP
ncbi:MAG: hypothetical protein R3E79_56550 [Caldilineaceae bacterium]